MAQLWVVSYGFDLEFNKWIPDYKMGNSDYPGCTRACALRRTKRALMREVRLPLRLRKMSCNNGVYVTNTLLPVKRVGFILLTE